MTQSTPTQHEHSSTPNMCPHYEAAMELLAKRWTGLILTTLLDEPARFSSISNSVDGISDRMLSQRLVELEEIGMVERKVDSTQRPVLVEYASTQMARELAPVFNALQHWAEKWMPARVND